MPDSIYTENYKHCRQLVLVSQITQYGAHHQYKTQARSFIMEIKMMNTINTCTTYIHKCCNNQVHTVNGQYKQVKHCLVVCQQIQIAVNTTRQCLTYTYPVARVQVHHVLLPVVCKQLHKIPGKFLDSRPQQSLYYCQYC